MRKMSEGLGYVCLLVCVAEKRVDGKFASVASFPWIENRNKGRFSAYLVFPERNL